MKLSRTAIKELTAAYRAVLKHALVASMGLVMIAPAVAAGTEDNPRLIDSFSNKQSNTAVELIGNDDWAYLAPESVVSNNENVSGGVGGAIYIEKSGGNLTVESGTKFTGNKSVYDGGAIGNYGTLNINGATFDGNKAQHSNTEDWRPIGGGAISLGVDSHTTITGTTFTNNESGYNGGAIGTRRTIEVPEDGQNNSLIITDSRFENNRANGTVTDTDNDKLPGGNGGAIANTFNTVVISDTDFTSNEAKTNGGAIYNTPFYSLKDNAVSSEYGGKITLSGTTFTGNTAANGGAIYNAGNMTIDKSAFESNTAVNGGAIMAYGAENYSADSDLAHLTITNSSFKGNVASDKEKGQALGGAIVAGRNSLVDIKNSVFEDNIADYAGAIFSYSSGIGSKGGMLNISGSTFKKNTALGAGAVQLMAESTVKNTKFVENKATIDTDGGGAVFVGAVGKVKMDNVAFIQNEAERYRGGAISTRSADLANNKDARLDILNSSFMRNTAGTTGGAIDNFLYSSAQDETAVYIDNSKFFSNNADMGGAVYNHGDKDKGGSTASLKISNSIFTGNKAKTNGGAIYNEKNGGITFVGTNVFSGNTSGATGAQVGNDIHNLGVVNIRGGETTFASGVSGTGTLTVADGATMNIGTAMIEQGTLNIDGVVLASIVDSRSHGRLYADNYNIGENGVLKLNVGKVGTYSIFKENATNMNIDAGAAYVATQNADGTVLIETKALEDLAADTGLSVKAAGVVAGLANSGDRSLSMLSLRVQNALDAGHTDYIEQEAGKLNPTEKPVAHSVASSVQNQIMNTVTNRMAALGAVGRNGGDVNAEYGLWAHGLINKSKYGSQFHGTTRGTAIGLDALINRAFTIGAGYAYASTDMHSRDRTTDIDSNTLFVYGQYKPSKGYVNGALNYTKSKYQENIKAFDMGIASDHDVFVYGGQVMTGYDFSVGLTPEAGVRYLHISQDDYSNGLARVKGTDSDFVTGTAGMKYSFLIQDTGKTKWRPELRAAATYDFVSDDTAVTVTMPGAAPYVVDGDRLSRFGGEFGLGLSIECPGLTLALRYDLDLHEDYTSQTGMAKLKLMF